MFYFIGVIVNLEYTVDQSLIIPEITIILLWERFDVRTTGIVVAFLERLELVCVEG